MKISIRFFGRFRSLEGTDCLVITLPEKAILRNAIRCIEERTRAVSRNDTAVTSLWENAIVMVNGSRIEDYSMVLKDMDELQIISPLVGG